MTTPSSSNSASKQQRLILRVVGMLVIVVIGALARQYKQTDSAPSTSASTATPAPPAIAKDASASKTVPPTNLSNDGLFRAIDRKLEKALVSGSGVVEKVLPDDTDGDRHQRLIVHLNGAKESSQTILIAHNIDLAERLDARPGDAIQFKGEFIWNDRGGVVHWTHRDPRKSHPDGYISINGRRSE